MRLDAREVLPKARSLCAKGRNGTPAESASYSSSYEHSNDAVRVVSEHIATLGREVGFLDETARVSKPSGEIGRPGDIKAARSPDDAQLTCTGNTLPVVSILSIRVANAPCPRRPIGDADWAQRCPWHLRAKYFQPTKLRAHFFERPPRRCALSKYSPQMR